MKKELNETNLAAALKQMDELKKDKNIVLSIKPIHVIYVGGKS